MAHVVEIADQAYQSLVDAAHDRGKTPQQLLEELLAGLSEQTDRRNAHSASEIRSCDRSDARNDLWQGLLGAAEATDPDILERHDHYLAEAHAGIPANIRDAVR